MENDLKWRSELKHYINRSDCAVIKSRLSQIAGKDAHTDESGGYRIRSLYFETPDDKTLREKLYGVRNREKFRIRLYNQDESFIRLEKKMKRNNLGCKISANLTREESEAIIAGDLEWMKTSERAVVIELYAKMKTEALRPKTIVDYYREPFIYRPGNVRVTFDSDIRTGIHSTDLFDKELPAIRPQAGDVIIMEVKFDEYLPDIIKTAIQIENRRSAAYSKYAICRMYG